MRLIDADKLISHLKDWLLQEAPFGVCEPESLQYETIKECIEAVKEQSTAYNVDKVVEQLDKSSDYYECDNAPNGTDCQMILLEQATEIVKGGGVE